MKWLPLFLSLLVFTNCTGDQNPSPTITIFAASSLTNAFTELAATYEATTNTTITLSFAGSSTLAAQIIEGAPADIFASANLTQAQMIAQEMDTDDAIVFAHNRPVIALPPDNPGQINSIDDLANTNLAIVLATPGVPNRHAQPAASVISASA